MVPETSDVDTDVDAVADAKSQTNGANDNAVFVGNKSVMDYVMAIMAQFNKGTNDVVVKARGHAISRAVDAVEVTRNRYMSDVAVTDIQIGTQEMEGKRGDMINVSWIELFLSRQ